MRQHDLTKRQIYIQISIKRKIIVPKKNHFSLCLRVGSIIINPTEGTCPYCTASWNQPQKLEHSHITLETRQAMKRTHPLSSTTLSSFSWTLFFYSMKWAFHDAKLWQPQSKLYFLLFPTISLTITLQPQKWSIQSNTSELSWKFVKWLHQTVNAYSSNWKKLKINFCA